MRETPESVKPWPGELGINIGAGEGQEIGVNCCVKNLISIIKPPKKEGIPTFN